MESVCIWCLKKTTMTREHIVPESLGGRITIDAVCQVCANKIGSPIDGAFINQYYVQLPRFSYEVEGKSGHIPNPFMVEGKTEEGKKIRLDANFKPHIIPHFSAHMQPDGSKRITIEVDGDDEENIDDVLNKKISRTLKTLHSDWDKTKIDEETRKVVEHAKTKITRTSSKPLITYQFKLDLDAFVLEYTKIAYEIAFHVFGYDYVCECKTAKILRDTILNRELKRQTIRGTVLDESLSFLFTDPEKHYILVLENVCYIRLFNFSGGICFNDSDRRFILSEDDAVIYILDFKNNSHKKLNFISYLSENFSEE